MSSTKPLHRAHRWTGNRGEGTAHYRAYDRSWRIAVPGKPAIDCSNDPALGGDPTRMNPEDLLLSALAGCLALLEGGRSASSSSQRACAACRPASVPAAPTGLRPGPDREIGDRQEIARDVAVLRQLPVEHAVKPRDLAR
jgi:hypothetical protein